MIETISLARTKLNHDDDLDFMPTGDSRDRLDIVYPNGNQEVLENRRALAFTYRTLPSGTNKCIGQCLDTENNAIIYAVQNSSSLHSIIRFNADNTTENISYGKTQWNFHADHPMTKMFVVGTGNDALLFMNDGYNPPRLVNLYNLQNNLYPNLLPSDINLYKPAPKIKPTVTLQKDTNVRVNKIIGRTFQFVPAYVYDTGQKSLLGHYSDLVYDYSDETVAGDFDTSSTDNNVKNTIIVGLTREYSNVSKIELYVRIGDIGSGVQGTWRLYDTIEIDDPTYDYYFRNDKNGIPSQISTIARDEEIPQSSQVAEFVDNRIILGQNNTGRDNVDIDVDLALVRIAKTNPTGTTTTSNPYQTVTDVDIVYMTGEPMSINVILAKVINAATTGEHTANPTVESYEKYYFLYNKYISSNVQIIDFFAENINNNTNFDITASVVVGGGHNNLLRITNNETYPLDVQYYVYTFVSPIVPKTVSFKENSRQQLAICYYENTNKSGRSIIVPTTLEIPPYSTSNHASYYENYIQYTIKHAAHSWTEAGVTKYPSCYQFMRAGNGMVGHFTVPIIVKGYYADVSDIVEDGLYTRVDVNAALDRIHDMNEGANFNDFTLQKGDRARVLGYINDIQATYIAEYIDVPVLGIDDDGKALLPTFHSFDEYEWWNDRSTGGINYPARPVYLFEFYRPTLNIDAEDLYYYEIGDVLPITGGYHTTSVPTGYPTPAINQSSGVNGVGVINFGDAYRIYWHFGARFVKVGLEVYLKPMFTAVESVSSSFMFPSRALSTGRYNWADPDEKNRTDSSLIYGSVFQSGELNYNDLNRFTNEPIYLDGIQGDITGLVSKGGTLEVYQEKKITPFYINSIVETLSDGTLQSKYSTAFLNQGTPSMFDVGCSHSMSIATNVYATYFFDLLTSSWYRRSQDGLKNITFDDTPNSGKMKNYGLALSKIISTAKDNNNNYYVRGAWDPVKHMYIFTYVNPSTTDDVTIGFHEPTNSWLSFYTLYEEMYASLNNNRFFSFNLGQIQEHHISETRMASGYVTVHFNKNPNLVKIFRAIEIGAEQKWVPSTDGDIYIESDALGYTDDDSYEFFYPRMTSSLSEGHFKGKEGSWTANFLRNTLTKLGTARSTTAANLYLYNGELLKGKTISIKLRNTKTNSNKLKYLTLRHDKSK
jgi:hypothetical protein